MSKYDEKRVNELLALRAKAIPAPWHLEHDDTFIDHGSTDVFLPPWVVELPSEFKEQETDEALAKHKDNCRFIASIHDLADQLEAAAEVIQQQREALQQIVLDCDNCTWECETCGRSDPISDMDLCGPARAALALTRNEQEPT